MAYTLSCSVGTVRTLGSQGMFEQYGVGLRHFRKDSSSMMSFQIAGTGAVASSYLKINESAEVSIINSETSGVFSGEMNCRLQGSNYHLKALPVPFPAHSYDLEPAHCQMSEFLCNSCMTSQSLSLCDILRLLAAFPLTRDLGFQLPRPSLLGSWRLLVAFQLTMTMNSNNTGGFAVCLGGKSHC